MAQVSQQVRRSTGWNQLPSVTTLASLQLRHVWRLLFLTGLGMIAAVMLACAVPLFALVSMSAGIRDALINSNMGDYLRVHTTMNVAYPQAVDQVTNNLNNYTQQYLGAYVHEPPQYLLASPAFKILSGDAQQVHDKTVLDQFQLLGLNTGQLDSHVKMVSGQLPQQGSSGVDIALTPQTAKYFQVQVGSVMKISVTCDDAAVQCATIPLHVVGIFQQNSSSESIWHSVSFQGTPLVYSQPFIHGYFMEALVSNSSLLNTLSSINVGYGSNFSALNPQPDILWYYHIDPARLNVNNMGDLVDSLNNYTTDIPTFVNTRPAMGDIDISTPSSDLQPYLDRIAVAQLPVAILAVLIFGLLLLFLNVMADILVERQTQMIALLRSRGSSARQIFGSFVIQLLFLALITFIIGPLLAIPVVHILVQHILPASDQEALDLVSGNPLQVLSPVSWIAALAALISIVTMIAAVYRATRMDVLTLRRESARSTRRPLWMRLYADVVVTLIGVVGYAFSLYMQGTGILDPTTRILLESPISLMSAIFFLVGASLLFLRFVPLLLQLGTRLTTYSKRVGPMLAVAQMSRSPQQTLRTALLLTFSIAFAIFVLVFNASQSQHIQEVAAYQTGADFSGTIQGVPTFNSLSLNQQTATYTSMPGVLDASLAHSVYVRNEDSNPPMVVKLLAVDPNTFVQSTLWSDQNAPRTVTSLIPQLTAHRTDLAQVAAHPSQKSTVAPLPAIVDAATWHSLKLKTGKVFTVNDSLGGKTAFVALAQVSHLPTVNDLSSTSANLENGILVDFQSAGSVFTYNTYDPKIRQSGKLTANYVWLHTKTDAHSLAQVRTEVARGAAPIDPLYDRSALTDEGFHDPLYLSIVGVLTLGALVPVLLALVSNLIASWISVRARLTNFAMLRAIGTSPGQLVSILTWEQGIVYTCALGLGLIFGLLLSSLTLPALVFTNASPDQILTGNVNFYALQNVPPIHVTIPTSMLLVVGLLILVCLLVLGSMVRTVSRPSLSQALRLNED